MSSLSLVGVFIASTVSSTDICTRRVNYPQSLGVFTEFCNCGILTGPTPLSLHGIQRTVPTDLVRVSHSKRMKLPG